MSSRRARLFRSNDRTQSYSNQSNRGRNHFAPSSAEEENQSRHTVAGKEVQYNVQNEAAVGESWDKNTYAQPRYKPNVATAETDWDSNAYVQSNQTERGWNQPAVPAERDWESTEYVQSSQTGQTWKQTVAPAERDWESSEYAQSSQTGQGWKQTAAAPSKSSQNWRQSAEKDFSNTYAPSNSQNWRQGNVEKDWESNANAPNNQNWRQSGGEKDFGNTYAPSNSQNWRQTNVEKDWDGNAYAPNSSQNWRQTVAPVEEIQDSGLYSQSVQGWKQNLPAGEESRDGSSYAQPSNCNKGRNYTYEEPVKQHEESKPTKLFGVAGNNSGIDWNAKSEPDKKWDAWDDKKTPDFCDQYGGGGSPAPGGKIGTMTFSNSRENSRSEAQDGHGGSRGQWSGDGGRGSANSNRESNEVEVLISSKLLGLIIGKGGSNIRDLQEKSGARIHVERNKVDSSGRASVMIVGSSTAQEDAKRLIEELIETDSQQALNRGGERPNTFRPADQFGGRDNARVSSFSTTNLEIPSNCVGKIIGKRGCMINDLQVSSEAKIRVERDNTGPITIISITGTDEAKARAEELIKELIEECNDYQNSPQGRYENAQRSGGGPEDDAENQGDNGCNRPDGWKNQNSPMKNRSQWSGNRASDASGDSSNTNGQGKPPQPDSIIDWDKIREADEEFMKVKWQEYPPIKKDFYIEDVDVANLETHEVERIRRDNNKIMVQHLIPGKGGHIPNPVRTFREAFGHYPEIMEEIRKVGFEKPSPIQMQAWPIILKGQDLIGIAQTGTGKTLAFLLPAFIHIEGQPAERNCRGGANVLVLTPTRELALQIEEEVKKYKYRGIKCVCVYGGGNRKEQVSIVTAGVEIMVATPGRLIDLISAKIVDIKSVTYLVLDEADRMLDMGFQPDIRKILLDIRPERQTIMTSATWPVGVRYLATNYMNNPIQVYVGSMDLTACHSVLQRVVMVEEDNKYEELTSLLNRELSDTDKVIVFIGRKAIVDYISTQFVLNEIDCQSIHGGREQTDREQALEDLKSGAVRILLATDVASRGIDIKDITHVINYDFPHNIEEYVHRVGRTGRAGRSGQSITFMTRKDWRYAQELIDIMEEAKQDVPQELYDMAARFAVNQEKRKAEGNTGGGFGGGGRGFNRGGNSFRENDFSGFGFGGGGGGGGGGRRRGGGNNSFAFSTDGF